MDLFAQSDFLWLAGFVLLSFTAQAMSGFGSVIIAVTMGSRFYPLEVLLPVLVPLDVIVNSYIVARHRSHVDRPVLFKNIIPFMAIGLVIGFSMFFALQGEILEKLFGAFITLLCVRELGRLLRNPDGPAPLSTLRSRLFILGAGIVQGMFASGGPLLVYAASRLDLTKSVFRSTLCALWLICNSALTLSYMATGKLTTDSVKMIAALFPVMIIGFLVGDRLHRHINDRSFRIAVYIVLLGAGLALVIK